MATNNVELQEILNRIYDTSNNKLCFSTANSNVSNENLSIQQIMNAVYDEDNGVINTQ